MVHTLPDYSSDYKSATVLGAIDSAELAARNMFMNTYDRGGNIIYQDDFEAACLKWVKVAGDTGSAMTLDATYARNGNQSMKLTTGDDGAKRIIVAKYLPLPVTSKIGFESSFTMHEDLDHYYMLFYLYNGTNLVQAVIDLRAQDDDIEYLKSNGAYGTLTTGIVTIPHASFFNTMKVVIDYASGDYIRCMLNETSYDMSSYSYRTTASATTPYMMLQIIPIGNVAENVDIWVDDVIVTQNES